MHSVPVMYGQKFKVSNCFVRVWVLSAGGGTKMRDGAYFLFFPPQSCILARPSFVFIFFLPTLRSLVHTTAVQLVAS